ncbi:RUN and SH3 domain-containing protein 1 isoform X1 [Sceloporus undulatus]|uniref:RUN and SH3 domain-containing protein 1 isoform X1 n=1 Tax=Sceloporus undulatus TaxID=8520 RepID=UPI001C4B898F|nr:RUN and SH3 domain-containing protein 1 isoform X1 [Sceloporus undulatus]
MQSPKKGLICNLNHVHLQHISLGLHLSRHPELQEVTNALIPPKKRAGCQDCRENNGRSASELDANSNNPLLTCQCCDGHPLHSDVKQDLQTLETLPDCPDFKQEEEEEEEEVKVDSPSDPGSSSISSCSDLSLDDSPISVCCKEFPAEEAQSPENQPNIVPLEEAHTVPPMTNPEERSLNLNIQMDKHSASHVWDSPDSLGSSSSLESTSDIPFPCSQTPVELPIPGSSSPSPLVPPPVRPCRAPPEVPVRHIVPELDSNCNALLPQEPKPESLSPGQVDINLNQAGPPRPCFRGVPPPVPPRTKRKLQGLRRCEPGKPNSEVVLLEISSKLSVHQDGLHSKDTKNITSFHELAQKRKKVAAMPPPLQTRKDQSDWLIVFSPDTELPPCHELTWGSVPSQETASHPAALLEPANLANCLQKAQKGVTTFKELRYQKQKGHQPPQVGTQLLQQVEPGKAMGEGSAPTQESDLEQPLKGHFRGPKEIPPRKKMCRPGLQPIMEGGFEDGEDGEAENKASERSLEDMPNEQRDPWMPGKEEKGDRCFMEVKHSSGPQHLPFQPLLVHFSVDGQAVDSRHSSSVSPSLESVELASPQLSGQAFCPKIKTLSCEEICLLANRQGQIFGTLSPEELLPIRLSPVGAYSPPARSALPFLESPDLAVLFSPLFPRSRTYPTLAFPPRQVPEQPFRARAPLDSQAGVGPGRVSRDSMGAKEPGVPEQLRHSRSFGGIPSTSHLWRTGTGRPSAQLQEQKKALLVAVSASVDKIVAHFSTARNLVQKAQLGDSRLSPDVGYLVLGTLCPALWALVGDGLKPFQKDVITGQRPSSPWSIVEASAKPGPQTHSLNALYWRVSRLAPLRSNQQRFHAFILGLLNMKQLEQWFSHLQRNSELILALYLPTAFLVLSQGVCRFWAEELLLLLQPLSMLTFQLDLLFEHHHLPLNVQPVARHAVTPTEQPTNSSGLREPDLLRHPVPPPELAEGPLAQSSPIHESQAGVPLHQRLLQWGDRLTHTLLGNEALPKPELCPQTMQQEMEEKQYNRWEQLNLASGIYANSTSSSISKQEGFPYMQWTKLRIIVGEAIKEACIGMTEATTSYNTGLQTPSLDENGSVPQASTAEVGNSPKGKTAKKPEIIAPKSRESSLADAQEANSDAMDTPGRGKGKWLGWLFGANYPGVSNELDSNLTKSRRPSSWLPPTMNVLALVMKTVPAEKSSQKESWEDASPDPRQAYRAVRALCNHVGSGDNELSFRKGDILQVLDTVDEDWLQCCHGDLRGLVPVGYTSLIL